MAFFIQHGHGKGEKIHKAILERSAEGVILGARHEQPDNIVGCANELAEAFNCERMIDPQFFVSTLSPANEGHLPEYPYYTGGLSAGRMTGRRMRTIALDTLRFQTRAKVTRLISPTVIFNSFNDRWFQIALNLADASLEAHAALENPPPLLLSFHFSEQALANHDDVARFLDTVTQDEWNMAGFYFAVARDESDYDCSFEADRLANLLYLSNVLGSVNEVEVVFGYADFCGALFRAAGATAFASGWHQGQRRFHRSKFLQRKQGGQQPRARYASLPLLNSIFVGELRDINSQGYLGNVLSGVPADADVQKELAAKHEINQVLQFQQHFQTLHKLDGLVVAQPQAALREMLRRIDEADELYATLKSAGIDFDGLTNGQHLPGWRDAIKGFAERAGFST